MREVRDPRAVELIELELLVAVAETGSLGQAAGRYGLTQPAVSMRMTALERRLGLRLLRREPSGTTLTAVGEDIVIGARRVLAAADALRATAERHRAQSDSRLRVTASFTVAEHLLPAWIGALQEEAPDLSLTIEVVNSSRVLDAVVEGRADVGFIEGVDREMPGLSSATVDVDALVVVVCPGHPWATRDAELTAGELARTDLVVRERGSGTREVLDTALEEWGGARTRLELGSSAALLAAARRGDGPTVISDLAAAGDVGAGHLVVVPTDGIDLTRRLRAVWRSDLGLSPLATRLVTAARAP